jgi:hypothetical protein
MSEHSIAHESRGVSTAPFVVLCVGIIVAALVFVLLLNTTMASGAYQARDLTIESVQLQEARAELLMELDARAAPQRLAERAAELGMARAGEVGFISLAQGTVTTSGAGG